MQDPPLAIHSSQRDGTTILRLEGEVDMATAPEVEAAVRDALAQTDLVIDLSGLSFLDSTGLRTMILAREQAERAGRRLSLVRGCENVHRVFGLTGLDRRFEWVEAPADES